MLYQIAALDGIARAEGGRVSYVKPHGALYNRAVWDPVQAGRGHRRDPRLRPRAAAAHPARIGGGRRGRRGRACASSARPSPTGPTTTTARWSAGGQPGAVLTDPQAVARRVVGAGDRRLAAAGRRRRRCGCWPGRSACTATPPAPWRWPGPCAARWRRPGRSWRRSHEPADAGRQTRAGLAGDAALLLDAPGATARLAAAISAAALPGVLDVVPGAACVLVVTEPGRWDLADLERRIAALPLPGEAGPAAREVRDPGPLRRRRTWPRSPALTGLAGQRDHRSAPGGASTGSAGSASRPASAT